MDILFLDPINQLDTSKKRSELRDAAARSHAAIFGHHRTKRRPKASTAHTAPEDVDAVTQRGQMLWSDIPDKSSLIPATSIYPGFGSFRSSLSDLLPYEAPASDLQVLKFFVEVTLPGIDVANEVFDNLGAFHYNLPNLVSPILFSVWIAWQRAITKLISQLQVHLYTCGF